MTNSGYQTIGHLARGGMGQVDLALREEGAFRRIYAIKRLRPEHRDDAMFREMFLEEGRIAGLLRHPNVVSVLDVGEDDEGPFLVMDLIDGVDASKLLKRLNRHDLALPEQIALDIAEQAARGLSAAHELVNLEGQSLDLIHRDVSPQNILLGFEGTVRVTDFGIAKALDRNAQTTEGLLKGKTGYISPERLRFERPDQRADLFALGVVLFELLTSNRLYDGKDAIETARSILTEPAPDVFAYRDDVHPATVELLFELLAKEPDARPEHAREVADRIAMIRAELIASEGVESLADFLTTHLADARTREQKKREAMLGNYELELDGLIGVITVSPTETVPDVTLAPTRSRSGLVLGGATLLLVVGGLVAWLNSTPSENTTLSGAPKAVVEAEAETRVVETTERASATEPSVARDSETEETDGTQAEVTAMSTEAHANADEAHANETRANPSETEPTKMRRRRRPRRRRTRAAMSTKRAARPTDHVVPF